MVTELLLHFGVVADNLSKKFDRTSANFVYGISVLYLLHPPVTDTQKVTDTESEAAAYEFTTLTCIPGNYSHNPLLAWSSLITK